MEIKIVFHVEHAGDDEIVWWIDSPDIDGFYAAGAGVVEARALALAALADLGFADAELIEQLGDGDGHTQGTIDLLVISGGG